MTWITAYHVSSENDLQVVTTNVCDDRDRDGYLYGANLACFTTTLYKGQLPDFSPYPRSVREGREGFRYVTTFDPTNYYQFRMAHSVKDGVEQVHFLLLDKRRPRERVLAELVRAFLREHDTNFNERRDWERYFPDGQPNNYTRGSKVFVNVMFWHDIPVRQAMVNGTHAIVKKGPVIPVRSVSDDDRHWIEGLFSRISNISNSNDEEDDVIDQLSSRLRTQARVEP